MSVTGVIGRPVVTLSRTQRKAIADAIDAPLSPDAFAAIVNTIEACVRNYRFHRQCLRQASAWWRVNPARQRRALKTMRWLRETVGLPAQDWDTMRALERQILAAIEKRERSRNPFSKHRPTYPHCAADIVEALEAVH